MTQIFSFNKLLNALVLLFIILLPNSPEHGASAALLLLGLSIYWLMQNPIEPLNTSTKWLLFFIITLFIFYVIGTVWQPDGLKNPRPWASIDYPFRWILLLPLLFIFREVKISWKILSWGISFACFIGLGIALYQVHILNQPRASAFMQIISFGETMVTLDLLSWILMTLAIKKKEKFLSFLLLASSLSGFYAALLSASRGAWLAYIVMIIVWLLLLFKSQEFNRKSIFKFQIWFRLVAMVVIFGFVSQTDQFKYASDRTISQYEKLTSENFEPTSNIRLELWNIAIKLSSEFPLGIGTGNFNQGINYINEKYQDSNYNNLLAYKHAHNQYYNILAENGWHTLILFITFQFFLIWYFWRGLSAKNIVAKNYAAMGLLLVFSFLIYETTQTVFNHHAMNLFYLIFLYLCFSQVSAQQKEEPLI